jgi:hypothetical protein
VPGEPLLRLAYWLPAANIFFSSLQSIQHHHFNYLLLSLDAFLYPACLKHVVCWANSVLEPANPPAQRGTFAFGLARSVVWVEIILPPFKLGDAEAFRIRAEIAEGRCATAEEQRNLTNIRRTAAQDELDTSRHLLCTAKADRDTAQAEYSSLKNCCDTFLGRVGNQMQ